MLRLFTIFTLCFCLSSAIVISVTYAETVQKEKEVKKEVLVDVGTWTEDYILAWKTAKKNNKALMMNFTGSDWCGWCIKLKADVFSKKEFTKWAKEKVVLLTLDFPKKKTVSKRTVFFNLGLGLIFEVPGFPTIIFVDVSKMKDPFDFDNMKETSARSGYHPTVKEWINVANLSLIPKKAVKDK